MHTGLNVSVVDYCDSTFDDIGDNDVIIALGQKNGEGRGGHTFFSPLGGLYMVMRVCGLHIDAHTLTPAVGLALHDTVEHVLELDTRLKWVNDLMYNGKKAAGILCKSPRRGEYLIGIGINYATPEEEFESVGLDDVATSLDAPISRVSFFVIALIRRIRAAILASFDCNRYNALCVTVGKTVGFLHNGVEMQGYAESVDAHGSLIVRLGMATVAVDAGEVSIIREI